TGSVKAIVAALEPGYAKVLIKERRAIRNHFRCVHALALVNAAELAGSLALSTLQPKHGRWIVTGLDAEYHKKARGLITAEAQVVAPDWDQAGDHQGTVLLCDAQGELVTTVKMRWRIGAKQ